VHERITAHDARLRIRMNIRLEILERVRDCVEQSHMPLEQIVVPLPP